MSIANTLRDISEESELSHAEKESLRKIANEYEKLQAENDKLKAEKSRLMEALNYELPEKYPDNCEVCKGAKAGVRGNENIVDDVVMCDYCTLDAISADAMRHVLGGIKDIVEQALKE